MPVTMIDLSAIIAQAPMAMMCVWMMLRASQMQQRIEPSEPRKERSNLPIPHGNGYDPNYEDRGGYS